jgi:hypothetical protein
MAIYTDLRRLEGNAVVGRGGEVSSQALSSPPSMELFPLVSIYLFSNL